MSMLAERRRKTKWVINPTKKPIWTTDSEGIKLGKQLMEKMGWSAGKGLGAKEQGIQEPLKVSYKNDTKGMGFKGNDEDWIEHQDEFNSLLSQLSSTDPNKPVEVDKNEIKSLEEKSKHSRARVHYQKFTRGKDLSRYSETDLACILGINRKKQKNSEEEKNPVEEKEKTDGNYETSFGVTTINSGSILDYFKKKWTIGKPKEYNSSEVPDEVTKDTLNNTEECIPTSEQKRSKKRKLDELDGENQQVPENGTIQMEDVENLEVGEEVKKNRKSKKQKLNEVDGESLEVPENEIVEASEEVGKESKKHKKSKKKKKEDKNIESGSVSKAHKTEKCDAGNIYQIEENNKDIQVTADVKNVSNDNNLSLDNKNHESSQLLKENSKDSDENFTRKRKKDKKKHKTKDLDTQDENLEPVQEDFDHKIKKKKKKDKGKKEKDHVTEGEIKEVSGENCSDKDKHNSLKENVESKSVSNGDEEIQKLDLVEDTVMKNSEEEKSKKEKRRKEKHKLDQSKLENEEELNMKCKVPAEEVESKSKDKKKKEKHSDQSIVENEEELEIKAKSIIEEVEPIVKEKKKKGKHKTDLPKLDNEKEQETEAKNTSEETDEPEIKKKKKKDKHKTDQSTLENEEEQVTKSIPKEIEPKVKEKISKKDKSSKTKKSKHKTDSEGIDKSNTNFESVEETNESKKLKKAEIDIKAKQDESKTGDSNRIHSHKVELFKKKKPSLVGGLPSTPNNRVMGLIFGAEFEKFKGANLENVAGYGMQKKIKEKGNG